MKEKIHSEKCAKCGKYKIFNKTHKLCIYCNFERTHGGQSMIEFQIANNKRKRAEKKKEQLLKQKREKVEKMDRALYVKNPITGTKTCSVQGCTDELFSKKFCIKHFWENKKAERRQSIKKKKKSQPKSSQQQREYEAKVALSKLKKESKESKIGSGNICDGCLKPFSAPLDYSHILSVGQRKDLETHPDNKNMLCRSCHIKWESNDPVAMTSLACFWDNMKFIRQHDKERFWKIYFEFNDRLMLEECKLIEEIDNEYNDEK